MDRKPYPPDYQYYNWDGLEEYHPQLQLQQHDFAKDKDETDDELYCRTQYLDSLQ